MNPESFDELVSRICDADERYDPDAYFFVREALGHAVKALGSDAQGAPRHVSGRELAEGFRDYALAEFGPLAWLVLSEWGLSKTADIGELVYNLISAGAMGKQAEDRKEDFEAVYDFEETFERPFRPRHPDAFAVRRA